MKNPLPIGHVQQMNRPKLPPPKASNEARRPLPSQSLAALSTAKLPLHDAPQVANGVLRQPGPLQRRGRRGVGPSVPTVPARPLVAATAATANALSCSPLLSAERRVFCFTECLFGRISRFHIPPFLYNVVISRHFPVPSRFFLACFFKGMNANFLPQNMLIRNVFATGNHPCISRGCDASTVMVQKESCPAFIF